MQTNGADNYADDADVAFSDADSSGFSSSISY